MKENRELYSRKNIKFGIYIALFCSVVSSSTAFAECAPDAGWLPKTSIPTFEKPPPHPAPDCGFYKPAWQAYLFVTQVAEDGKPAFLSFSTIADVFGVAAAPRFAAPKPSFLSLAPRALKGSNDPLTDSRDGVAHGDPDKVNAGVRQAGLNGLLIDQKGIPVFYAIHMNNTFADFIRRNNLTTKSALQGADPNLEFPTGAIELKSAWRIVPEDQASANYITTRARVPALKATNGKIDVDNTQPPREVTVALLSIHVVFVLEKHPEFIWATFEHIDDAGNRDLAPAAKALPSGDGGLPGGVDGPVSDENFQLYKAGTLASKADVLLDDNALLAAFNPLTQDFTKGGVTLQTSIFRRFPGSSLFETAEDDDIVSLNDNMARAFKAHGSHDNGSHDKRANYQLVGAVWLDKPDKFVTNSKFSNPPGVKTDDPSALVAGEDALSSMAMESFTQDSFVNCFSCHDTRPVRDPSGALLMPAKKLNVSHILSKFISEAK